MELSGSLSDIDQMRHLRFIYIQVFFPKNAKVTIKLTCRIYTDSVRAIYLAA